MSQDDLQNTVQMRAVNIPNTGTATYTVWNWFCPLEELKSIMHNYLSIISLFNVGKPQSSCVCHVCILWYSFVDLVRPIAKHVLTRSPRVLMPQSISIYKSTRPPPVGYFLFFWWALLAVRPLSLSLSSRSWKWRFSMSIFILLIIASGTCNGRN